MGLLVRVTVWERVSEEEVTTGRPRNWPARGGREDIDGWGFTKGARTKMGFVSDR